MIFENSKMISLFLFLIAAIQSSGADPDSHFRHAGSGSYKMNTVPVLYGFATLSLTVRAPESESVLRYLDQGPDANSHHCFELH
jgi:hypothetical protein